MFRRRTQAAPVEPAGGVQVSDTAETPDTADTVKGRTPGKGRPTPKRKEAEQRRRQPVTAPRDRKEAYRQMRERQRRERERAREAMRRGDDRYLPARDRGPVRAFARDFVDSRRTISEFFLWLSLAVVVLATLPVLPVKNFAISLLWPLMMIVIVVESAVTAHRVRKLAAARFPGENVRGVGLYAAMRALQMRRFRIPEPRVKIGDKI